METAEHLELLLRGAAVWNLWKVGRPLLRANLGGADLRGARLEACHLNGAIFNAANLDGADLTKAVLIEANFIGAAARGASFRRASLWDANLFQANLREADFERADLRSANLSQASLRGARLDRADLRAARLRGADLFQASLDGADLSGADLSGADLFGASLRGATLRGTDFDGAQLEGADFGEAKVGWTRFGDVDLSAVQGLERVEHLGPSSVGIDTVYRSRARIPELFLRGAGVPDLFLTYMSSLVGQAFEFFACFISASPGDKRFCDRLHADLQASGVRTWYLREETTRDALALAGVDRSLKVYDKLVLVCSEASLKSEAVVAELERALEREDERGKKVLFPVRLDDYAANGWQHARKADLLERLAADFRGWERDAGGYAAEVEGLVEALRAGG